MQPLQSARGFRTFLHDTQSFTNRRSRLGLFTLEDRQAAGSLMDMLLAGAMASDRAQPIPAPADDPRFGVVTATTALPETDTVALLGQAHDEAANGPAGEFVTNPAGQFSGFDDFEAGPNTPTAGVSDWRIAPFITLGTGGGFVDEAVSQPFSRATLQGDTAPVPTLMKSNEIPSFFRPGVGTVPGSGPQTAGSAPSGSGGGDGGGDGYDDVEVISKAVVTQVEYLGPVIRIAADPGTPQYPMSGPQYVDNNADGIVQPEQGDLSLPIAYPRDSTITGNATFKVETELYPGPGGSGNVWIEAYGYSGMFFPKLATWTGDTVTVSGLSSYNPLLNYVQYGDASELHFVLRRGTPVESHPIYAGKSVNELYVTLAAPTVAPLYHTLIHLSVPISAAVNAADDATVIAQTWKNFETRAITDKHINPAYSGLPLHYYKEWTTTVADAPTLLVGQDGNCYAWSRLFGDTLKAAGSKTQMQLAEFQSKKLVGAFGTNAPQRENMLINNWDFIGNFSSGNATWPWQNMSRNPDIPGLWMAKVPPLNVWDYVWGNPVEATRLQDGILGQNTSNPLSKFFVHAQMKISGVYYDPSYGTTYTSHQDWEDNAVAGFIISDLAGKRFLLRNKPTVANEPLDTEESLNVYTGFPLPGPP